MCHELIVLNLEKREKHTIQGKNENLSSLGWKYNTLFITDGVQVSNGCLYLNP